METDKFLDEEQFGSGVKKKVITENDKYGEKQILIESSKKYEEVHYGL